MLKKNSFISLKIFAKKRVVFFYVSTISTILILVFLYLSKGFVGHESDAIISILVAPIFYGLVSFVAIPLYDFVDSRQGCFSTTLWWIPGIILAWIPVGSSQDYPKNSMNFYIYVVLVVFLKAYSSLVYGHLFIAMAIPFVLKNTRNYGIWGKIINIFSLHHLFTTTLDDLDSQKERLMRELDKVSPPSSYAQASKAESILGEIAKINEKIKDKKRG
jgi:hypothetical protein